MVGPFKPAEPFDLVRPFEPVSFKPVRPFDMVGSFEPVETIYMVGPFELV